MKKKFLKLFILVIGLFTLTGCQTQFCSPQDEINIKTGIRTQMDNGEGSGNYAAPTLKSQLQQAGITVDDSVVEGENMWSMIPDDIKNDYVNYIYNTYHPKACLVTEDHTDKDSGATISKKSFKYAAQQGLLELIAYPVSFLLVSGAQILGGGNVTGTSIFFSIILVTFLVRAIILLLTLKSTKQSQKIQQLQPEMDAINAKYANKTDPQSKQAKTMEIMKLYKKHDVKPGSALLTPFITLPILIGVYSAVKDSTILFEGSFAGLEFGDKLGQAITSGSVFAIFLFVFMGAIQFVTMRLPTWIAKSKQKSYKKVEKQGMSQTDMMSYFFIVMILIIGWMLPTGMSLYWIASSLFSVGQTFLVEAISKKERK